MKKEITLFFLIVTSTSCLFGQVGLNVESFATYEKEMIISGRKLDSLIVQLSTKTEMLYDYDRNLFYDLYDIISTASSLSTKLRLLVNEFRLLLILKSGDENISYDIRYLEQLGTRDGDIVKDDLIQAWEIVKNVIDKVKPSSPLNSDLILLTLLYLKADAHITFIIGVNKN